MRTPTRVMIALVTVLLTAATGTACTATMPGGLPGGGGGGASHRQIRYGPFTIPARQGDRMGMIDNQPRLNIQKPCTGCYVTGIRAGLVDPSGRSLNVDTNQWLHHMVLINSSATNLVCTMGRPGEWFFASGNERTPIDLTASGSYGYPVGATDSWQLIADLMNMATTPTTAYITVDYDYVPLTTPGMRRARPIWIDGSGCPGASNIPVPAGQTTFARSGTWNVQVAAKLLYIHVHLHDGATDGKVFVDGRQVCDSVQTYGGPHYVEPGGMDMPGMDMGGGMAHISHASACVGTRQQPLATLRPGDRVTVTGYYDANQHPLMRNNGRYEPVMVIGHGWVDVGG